MYILRIIRKYNIIMLNYERSICTLIKKRRYYKRPKSDDSPDVCDLAEKAMFYNPVASVNDCTGFTPIVPINALEAESYCELLDVNVTSRDGEVAYAKKK